MGIHLIFGEPKDVFANVSDDDFDELTDLSVSQVVYCTVLVNGVDWPVRLPI